MRSFHSLLGATGLLLSAALLSLAAQGATPVAAETVANPSVPTALDLQLAQAGPTVPASVPGGEALLFDNGPFVTNPGAGFGGADASAVQTALGVSGYGFGHAISSGFRVADDFTVPAGGWTINAITFYAYQTGSTTTTTINNINLRIWDGVPGAPGSNIVFGDTTTNRLASSSSTNAYRVADYDMLGDTRPIMASAATVGTNLGAGTYWLDWQSGGTLGSGPWAPPVTIAGTTGKPGANGMQFNGSAWGPLVDTIAGTAQDLPFVIDGTEAATAEPPRLVPAFGLVGGALLGLLLAGFALVLLQRRAG